MIECKRCLMNSDIPGTVFDADGVCNYCRLHDDLDSQYPVGRKGRKKLEELAEEIKRAAFDDGSLYDCVVGVSGGCDSSFLLHTLHGLGLRCLAVHYDNTWDSEVAQRNIERVTKELEVSYWTKIVNNREMDDIYRAFIVSGTRDIEAPTDLGLTTTLYIAASMFNVKYICSGHSFRTEGIAPLGWSYMDGRYIKDVHSRFGKVEMKTFPNLYLGKWLWYLLGKRFKRVRPLYYVKYHKPTVKWMLSDRYGWEWYGGHHLENWFTKFFINYYRPRRFGFDTRYPEYSARIRDGEMTKEEAKERMKSPLSLGSEEKEILHAVRKRLGFNENSLNFFLYKNQKKSYRDFKNYKRTFERMRWFFKLMLERDVIPRSFYEKYCLPDVGG